MSRGAESCTLLISCFLIFEQEGALAHTPVEVSHAAEDATSAEVSKKPPRPRPAFVTEIPQMIEQSTLVQPTQKARSAVAAFMSHMAHVAIAAPVAFWAAADALLAFESVRLAHAISPAWRPGIVSYGVDGMAVTHAVIFFLSSYSLGLYGRQVFNWRLRMLVVSAGASALAVSATTLFEAWVSSYRSVDGSSSTPSC